MKHSSFQLELFVGLDSDGKWTDLSKIPTPEIPEINFLDYRYYYFGGDGTLHLSCRTKGDFPTFQTYTQITQYHPPVMVMAC